MTDFQNRREQSIQENRQMLQKLGFKNVAEKREGKRRKLTHSANINGASPLKTQSSSGKKRFSARLQKNGAVVLSDNCVNGDGDIWDEGFDIHTSSTKKIKIMNSYGRIEGIEVGESWPTRLECSNAGVHRPTVAGIHAGHDGAYSIALSGGYVDDVDCGETFTYTGAGGRDLKGTRQNPKNLRTAPQSKDQVLDNFNKSLITSTQTKNPVRVIRGYKLGSPYAPEEGYRYDGLYTVEKYWTTVGLSGFLVYKFSLKRCDGQAPPPWLAAKQTDDTDIPPSHLHDTSRNDSVQAIESPSGRVKSRRQHGKFHCVLNQSSSLRCKLDCNEEDGVNGAVNRDFNLSNENSSTINNCVNDENSRRKINNSANSYDQATSKSKTVDSCRTSFTAENLINKKYSERTSAPSQSRVSFLTKISSSPDQKIDITKVSRDNGQKLISKKHSGESKISLHTNGLKQQASIHDTTVILNSEKCIETSISNLTEVVNCNSLKSASSSSSVLILGTKQCRYSGVTKCLNNLEKKTPKNKAITDGSIKCNNLNKSDSSTIKVDNISKETEFGIEKINETKFIKKTENNKDSRSDNSVKKCCVELYRFDKHLDRNVYDNAPTISKEKHDLWYGWDDIGKQNFFGFKKTDLSKAWSTYVEVYKYSESLNKYIKKECTNDEDDCWQGW